MENIDIIAGIGVVFLAVFLWLINKNIGKILKTNNTKEDLGIERVIKADITKISERLALIEDLRKDYNAHKDKIIDLENLFNNKTERGKLGEELLEDIVQDALPSKYYVFQHTLSNGKRADCFLTFGTPNESICIDSKFSWENYKKMIEEKDEQIKNNLRKQFTVDINKHIKDVSEKYVVSGETAPLALMFVASEGVFRAIEENPQNFVKKAREKNVVIVSPNTLWSFFRTYKLLIQNKEMYEQSGIIQKEVGELYKDIGRLSERIGTIDRNHNQISESFRQIKISMEKIQNHATRIVELELEKKDIKAIDDKKIIDFKK